MGKIGPIMMIAVSATLWGIIAIFVRKLALLGFTSMEIVTLRVVTAVLLLGIIGITKYPGQMKIRFVDSKYFIGTGIFSIVLFNWCYFTAINQMSLSFAVILLYTAPTFVVVLSYLFLKENMDSRKIISVIGTLIGCALIVGVSFNDSPTINLVGILTGLGAGFGYALYTIFGKFALVKYRPFTVTFYTFLVAAVTLLLFTDLIEKRSMLVSGEVIIYGVSLGLFPTVIAYLLYTKGLEKMESSKASIIATVEPVAATLLSVFLYKENFGMLQFVGTVIILLSVILINLPKQPIELIKTGLQHK
ncbi:drug/metabolite transporter (DMT)-like permease [Bacillus niacini]|uniref:Drug/metabolite transporter (DMT)-like permease n=1 Tax=Neobacillus niacini TaxID=86668 RepID=A0A852TA49_9BACI|nr:EamA family transporter [Neobacillus niacini]NYE04745.1 drug/metabolite transporter (DMT)-like permease [Neobacillus niacini]